MRVGTPLENWRIAERTLSAIDQRIAELRDRTYLSSADSGALAALERARDAACRLADKCWALYRQEFDRRIIQAAPEADHSPAEP
jgi:hypothetical protein